jgi:hypothetical protein
LVRSWERWELAMTDAPDPRVARVAEKVREAMRPAPPSQGGSAEQNGMAEDTGYTLPEWPAPPAPAAYHGLAGEVVLTIAPETEADPVALLTQFLTAFGSLARRQAHCTVGKKWHHTNLFTVLVGKTAKGRKGTSWSWIESLMKGVETGWAKDRVSTGLSSGEGLIFAVRDPDDGDEGVTDKRLLVVEEEFASPLRMMTRDGNILDVVLRQAWDSGNLKTMTRHHPMRATDAHISLVGHTTRAELVTTLTETSTKNGFANRFLWACARRSKLLPDGGEDLDLGTQIEKLRAVAGHAAATREVRRTPGAAQLWREEYERLTRETPGILGLVTGRAEAQVLRLSLIYALLDLSESVGLPHLRAALALWDYVERSCQYVFGESTGSSDADDLLEALRASGNRGMTRTEISQHFQGHRTAAQIKAILGLLVESMAARFALEKTGGRERERWFASGAGCEISEESEISP